MQELPQDWEQEAVRVVRPGRHEQALHLYLRALLSHSEDVDGARRLVHLGVLDLLWHLVHDSTDPATPETLRSLAVQVVANCSCFYELHVAIFQSGRFCNSVTVTNPRTC